MKQQSNYYAPIHNSVGPVKMLLDQGVSVGLGIDNIEDIFVPFCDGDLSFEKYYWQKLIIYLSTGTINKNR